MISIAFKEQREVTEVTLLKDVSKRKTDFLPCILIIFNILNL